MSYIRDAHVIVRLGYPLGGPVINIRDAYGRVRLGYSRVYSRLSLILSRPKSIPTDTSQQRAAPPPTLQILLSVSIPFYSRYLNPVEYFTATSLWRPPLDVPAPAYFLRSTCCCWWRSAPGSPPPSHPSRGISTPTSSPLTSKPQHLRPPHRIRGRVHHLPACLSASSLSPAPASLRSSASLQLRPVALAEEEDELRVCDDRAAPVRAGSGCSRKRTAGRASTPPSRSSSTSGSQGCPSKYDFAQIPILLFVLSHGDQSICWQMFDHCAVRRVTWRPTFSSVWRNKGMERTTLTDIK